ncbi:1151_t:CDS:2 [Acaulospora morrowiae]|uniref:1151_t:CDS:1 n=1 Tax=Acaulospora morrowiae TaxID=94023 RepID=A0A9N9D1L6_9GLOM|nr:1151_t:CDS:2 [Acaulospora morrowiae]
MIGHRLGPVSTIFFDTVRNLQTARNLDTNICYKTRSLLEENGKLEDINEEKNALRFCTEDGNLGKAVIDNTKTAFYNMKPVAMPILGVSSEKFDEMVETCAKELEDNKSYHEVVRVYGRKKGII